MTLPRYGARAPRIRPAGQVPTVSVAVRSALAGCALAGLVSAGSALAHSYLRSSVPAGGSTVEQPPAEVVITFTEALEPKFSGIDVTDGHGHSVAAGPAHASGTGATELTVPLKPLKPGSYEVRWHVLSTDTHKTKGSFTFDVAAPD